MSKFQARAALDQLVGRPALVSQTYAGQGIGLNSEVTSGAMLADIRALAEAVPVDEAAAYKERCAVLASAFGLDVTNNDKPFIYANGFALIPIHGLLINRFSWSWGFVTGYNFIRNQVTAAFEDDDVQTILYDVNSCGGGVAGCRETADLIFEANAANGGKTMIAVVDANCYSAAYYLASQCDHIAITPSGGCANIGVLQMHFDISKMMDDMGVKVSFIVGGAHKVDGNPYEPLSDEVRAEFQADIDAEYDTFVATVARGRGIDEQVVRDTEARTYGAVDALALGLVDAIQNPSDAVETYFASCEDGEDDNDDDTTEPDDDDTTEPEESEMAVKPSVTTTTKPAAAAAAAAATPVVETTSEVTSDEVSATARVAERQRIAAIQTHAEAEGRTALAAHLALGTDLDVETATGILAKSPKEGTAAAAVATPAPTAETNHFKAAMNNGQQPNVGAGGGASEGSEASGELTGAARILAAQSRATGFKAVTTH